MGAECGRISITQQDYQFEKGVDEPFHQADLHQDEGNDKDNYLRGNIFKIILETVPCKKRIHDHQEQRRFVKEECWSSSVLTATASGSTTDLSVGGIAGALINGGIVKNSYFAGRATGPAHVSGIADWCQGQYEGYVGQIINCYNIGTLSATTRYALGRYSGSILAANKANAILNSYYFDSHTTYDWATGAKKVSKSYLGSG